MSAITVVKLGGSLCRDAGDGALLRWLADLAARAALDADRRWVIVPGGGEFADTVRAAQADWGFDDVTAHNMALLAMEQTARLMVGLPAASTAMSAALALTPATDIDAIRAAWAAGLLPVWGARDALRSAPDALTRWDVTSDSLAAWLAGRLGADRLVLVKHGLAGKSAAPAAEAEVLAQGFAAAGIVDAALPAMVAAAGVALALWPAR